MVKRNYAVCFGEVLWDVFEGGKKIGGAPLNVCYHLSQLGVPGRIISQVGEDADGRAILLLLHDMGLQDHYCRATDDYPTSTVAVKSTDQAVMYHITDNVAWDHIPVDQALFEVIEMSSVFVYGSLAARSEVSRNTLKTYLLYAKWKVFDVNLRQSHYSREGIELLLKQCDTLKVNDEELALLGQWFGSTATTSESIISMLIAAFPNISEVIVTMGGSGAVYFSKEQEVRLPGVHVDVVDTVGCGDAFLAAFIANKLAGRPVADCLQQAVLLSAFVATHEGGCPEYRTDDLPLIHQVAF